MRSPLVVTVPVTKGLNLFSQRRDLLFQFAHLSAWKSLLLLAGPPPPLSTCGDWLEARPPRCPGRRFLPMGCAGRAPASQGRASLGSE